MLDPRFKILALRRPDICACGTRLTVGERAAWDRVTRTVRCLPCLDTTVSPEPGSTPAQPSLGTAGASAQAEFERRRHAREHRIRQDHPHIGGLLLALTDDPQSTRAWQSGAIGERRLAAELTELGDTVTALHDRRIPGSRANIDHVVIGPAGIYVIDAKRYRNAKISLRRTGGLFTTPRTQLIVSGRDKTSLVTAMARQVDAVRTALAATAFETTPVTATLCFLDADFPVFGKPLTLDGVHIKGLRGLTKLVTSGGPLDRATRQQAAECLASKLPTR